MMKDGASVTFNKEDGFEVRVGDKVVPLSIIADPIELTLGPDRKTVRLELFLASVSIRDIEAIAEYVRFR